MSTYFEAHVILDPVFDERLDELRGVAELYGFRVADLFMQKRREDSPERSRFDSFLTGRHRDFKSLDDGLMLLLDALDHHGFVVRRYKMESTIYDVRLAGKANGVT